MNTIHVDEDEPRPTPVGFAVEVTMSPLMGEDEQTSFVRRLEDYVSSRRLRSGFSQLQGVLWKDDTDLTLADQCDLLVWLSMQPGVSGARVSELMPVDGDGLLPDIEDRQLRMSSYSIETIAGGMLYRLGAITPQVLASVLGGFVVPGHAATAH